MKNVGKPYEGELHVRFDEEGLGIQSFTLQTRGKKYENQTSYGE